MYRTFQLYQSLRDWFRDAIRKRNYQNVPCAPVPA
jgi:hypothetical protein